ncbi:hypothetical protein HQ545_04615 [Candidatus Woesearchaeota archaeon]|nr:hypothetical protein [Candidatus Woesearchaeota archaeon]
MNKENNEIAGEGAVCIDNILDELIMSNRLRDSVDVSMLSEEDVERVCEVMAEYAVAEENLELLQIAGRSLLKFGKYDEFIRLGRKVSNSECLQTVTDLIFNFQIRQETIPGDVASDMVDMLYDLCEQGGDYIHTIAGLMAKGGLKSRAEATARNFFDNDSIRNSLLFMDAAGAKFSAEEYAKMAEIALERGDGRLVANIYMWNGLAIPKEALTQIILDSDGSAARDGIFAYIGQHGEVPSPEEVVSLAEKVFKKGYNKEEAFKLYKRAEKMSGGNLFSSDKYWELGEQILSSEESSRFTTALIYLSEHDPENAKARIVEVAEANIARDYELLYRFCSEHDVELSTQTALAAAEAALDAVAHKQHFCGDDYRVAAAYYKLAGVPENAKGLGQQILQDDSPSRYGKAGDAIFCFKTAGDPESRTIIEFLRNNT